MAATTSSGSTAAYFTQQRNKYQAVVETAQTAAGKVEAANEALQILAQPAITPAQVDRLFELHTTTS